jgi:hypothetical protein
VPEQVEVVAELVRDDVATPAFVVVVDGFEWAEWL